MYSYYSDFNKYPGELFAFKPLPVSDIVPILDCVNEEGTGYFSYTNKENTHIVIPYASDRNNLSPMVRHSFFPLLLLATATRFFNLFYFKHLGAFDCHLKCHYSLFVSHVTCNSNANSDGRTLRPRRLSKPINAVATSRSLHSWRSPTQPTPSRGSSKTTCSHSPRTRRVSAVLKVRRNNCYGISKLTRVTLDRCHHRGVLQRYDSSGRRIRGVVRSGLFRVHGSCQFACHCATN